MYFQPMGEIVIPANQSEKRVLSWPFRVGMMSAILDDTYTGCVTSSISGAVAVYKCVSCSLLCAYPDDVSMD